MEISTVKPKSKDKRFRDVASNRTESVLKAIRLLKKCSNKRSYQYDKADVNKIFRAIKTELDECRNSFLGTDKAKEFKL